MELFVTGVLGLGVALVVNIIFNRWGIPVIIGYIATGILISSYFHIADVVDPGILSHIAEFGIVFLMFMIGLEFSFSVLKSMKQEVIIFGGLQILLSALVFFLIAFFVFHIHSHTAFIIGSALSLSSTAIVLKSFNETKEINTGHGRNAVGILIMQDIAVIPILLMISILGSDNTRFEFLITHTTLNAILVVLILFYPAKWVIATLLKNAAKSQMNEIFMGAILFIVLSSSLFAYFFGFSFSLGAFIAGMIIAGTRYKYKVEVNFIHFRDLFLGLFFITVGMQVDVSFLIFHIHYILMLLVGIMFLKALVIFIVIRFYRSSKIAFNTALSLCQVGEFSFAIFALSSSQNNLLDSNTHQLLMLCVIFSMICTPFILKYLNTITQKIFGILRIKAEENSKQYENAKILQNHVIVCGYGLYGKMLVQFLKEMNTAYIGIDSDIKRANEAYKNNDNIIFGDITQSTAYHKLHIQEAAAIVLTFEDIQKAKEVCINILQKFPHCNIILQIPSENQLEHFRDMNIHTLICIKTEVAKLLGTAAINCVQESIAKENIDIE